MLNTAFEFVLVIAIIIQLLIWCGVFTLPLRKKQIKSSLPKKGVSIVICAHNEYNNLVKLLPLLLTQNYEQFEIIVIDDRSTDLTSTLSDEFKNSPISFYSIDSTQTGFNSKKYALKKGTELAKYNYLLLTDADCVPNSSDWVSAMMETLPIEKGIVLGLSPYLTCKSSKVLDQIIQFETCMTAIQFTSLTLFGFPYMGLGRNILYHKEIIQNSSLLHQNKHITGGDDDLLVNEMATTKNTAINLKHNSFTFSVPKTKWKDWIRQKHRHLSVSSYYSLKSMLLLTTINSTHLLSVVALIFTLCKPELNPIFISLLVLRTSVIFYIFGRLNKKMGGHVNSITILISDIVYPFYLVTLGFYSLAFKANRWN